MLRFRLFCYVCERYSLNFSSHSFELKNTSLFKYTTHRQLLQPERCIVDRHRPKAERSILIQNGQPSVRLKTVLKEIFMLYLNVDDNNLHNDENLILSYPYAARLWYRCGMKISQLDSIIGENNFVRFNDFMQVIQRVIDEDTMNKASDVVTGSGTATFEVSRNRCW
jgi:hypothetical protein